MRFTTSTSACDRQIFPGLGFRRVLIGQGVLFSGQAQVLPWTCIGLVPDLFDKAGEKFCIHRQNIKVITGSKSRPFGRLRKIAWKAKLGIVQCPQGADFPMQRKLLAISARAAPPYSSRSRVPNAGCQRRRLSLAQTALHLPSLQHW